jgi:predicted hydrolase (HD superfamily)
LLNSLSDKTTLQLNRIERVREYVDRVLLSITDAYVRRCGYLHIYGVAQACALIALRRGENAELATIAGMLHDIYTYSTMDPREHAVKGAVMAREILASMEVFSDSETGAICAAICSHSDKSNKHSSFAEVLVDADVMQHCLYNPLFDISEHERQRFGDLKCEFGLL